MHTEENEENLALQATLAGVGNSKDLLPELPLPGPIVKSNKSLFFYPKVAADAKKLLKTWNEALAVKLNRAINQTSAQNINLICNDTNVNQNKDAPKLLQTMVAVNPNLFPKIGESKKSTSEIVNPQSVVATTSFRENKVSTFKVKQETKQYIAVKQKCPSRIKMIDPKIKLVEENDTINQYEQLRKSIVNLKNNNSVKLCSNLIPIVKVEKISDKTYRILKNNQTDLNETQLKHIKEDDPFSILAGEHYKLELEKTKPVVIKTTPQKECFKPALSIEDKLEMNICRKFQENVDYILKFDSDIPKIQNNAQISDEYLLIQEICTQAAQLNNQNAMEMIPIDNLIKLFDVLKIRIQEADEITPIINKSNNDQIWIKTSMERIMGAANASLACMYIMTSRNMHKRIYIEEVIDCVILFTNYQMNNTIFPLYDVTYQVENRKKVGRQKKAVLEQNVSLLYNKMCKLVSKISDLLNIQILTDNSILRVSSMGVSSFFTKNITEMQLSCLKLVTNIFINYENHRKVLFGDILASMGRLPSSKRNLHLYKLNSNENIQILTALVLQMLQSIAVLPENLFNLKNNKYNIDKDVFICNKSNQVMTMANFFLISFLTKCANRNEETDYRLLFENFVQDLISMVNKPEWPVTTVVLRILGNLLITKIMEDADLPLRLVSLDLLGIVTTSLRRNQVLLRCKQNVIDKMIKEIKYEELKNVLEKDHNLDEINGEERIQFLQRVLLNFLEEKTCDTNRFAWYFYIMQWYKECIFERNTLLALEKNCKKIENRQKNKNLEQINKIKDLDARKKLLITRLSAFKKSIKSSNQIKVIDYNMAEVIAQYLTPKQQYFDKCLAVFLVNLKESLIPIRTKAIKCLNMIIEADPSLLRIPKIEIAVTACLHDHSTLVREVAVDLIGKSVMNNLELLEKFYEKISERIIDTGVSVRKRVINILKDICVKYPEFSKTPEIYFKIIKRVNDEESIKKLVMEVFQNLWFIPSPKSSKEIDKLLDQKVINITNLLATFGKIGLECFEQLLVCLFKPKNNQDDSSNVNATKVVLIASEQIVDCLIKNILQFEKNVNNDGSSVQFLAYLTTLYLFAKIRPQLLIRHAIILQQYLTINWQSKEDSLIIVHVAKIMELVVPLMEHPGDLFLAQLEEDTIKLIFKQNLEVVTSCISCLSSIISRVTHHYKLIDDCFKKFYYSLDMYYKQLQNAENHHIGDCTISNLYRSMLVVSLFMRYFDFANADSSGDYLRIKQDIYEMLFYFLKYGNDDIQMNALNALGIICIRHYEFMLENKLKSLYHRILTSDQVLLKCKIRVLNNISNYLAEEDSKINQLDLEWKIRSKHENLKEMDDIAAGMASTIIQLYLKEILQCYLHTNTLVRSSALKVIQLVLQQGLVNPVQIVPHLICMSTDTNISLSRSANKHLDSIEKKYPGFIYAKTSQGICLSYELQTLIQRSAYVRGFKIEKQHPRALNGHLYSLLRNSRQQRRALLLNLLKQFEEQACSSLSYMLYLADNLAYLPYQVQDEPLFLVHHIELIISVSGPNLLETFRDSLLINGSQEKLVLNQSSALDEDDVEETLIQRIPEDASKLQACITAAQGSILLLILKEYIKETYELSDGKIHQYSPSEQNRIYEKAINRKNDAHFNSKTVADKLQNSSPSKCLDHQGKTELIREYLNFKQLVLKMDLNDRDAVNDTRIQNADKSVLTNINNSTPNVAKRLPLRQLDSDRKRTLPQKKCKQMKKRRLSKKKINDTDSDSSDPDFVA